MSAVIDLDVLSPALAALIPDDAPELVTPGWVYENLGVLPSTVIHAIKTDRLPALTVAGGKGKPAYGVRPQDAVRLWGQRILSRRARAAEDKT